MPYIHYTKQVVVCTSMSNFNNIVKEVFHDVMRYLELRDVYIVFICVNKCFNDYIKTLSYNDILITPIRMEKIMNVSIHTYTHTHIQHIPFVAPEEIVFSGITFSEEMWKCVKCLNPKIIRYYDCNMNDDITIPKNVREIDMHHCRSYQCVMDITPSHFNKIVELIEKERYTLESLTMNVPEHAYDEDLQKIFSLCLTELTLYMDSSTHNNTNKKVITKSHLEKMSNLNEMRELTLEKCIFDATCNNLIFFKNHMLTYLDLSYCNIYIKHVTNIIIPSLLTLKLSNTYVDDEFIKQLNILKQKQILNLNSLDIAGTKVTQMCFKHLNVLGLTDLDIDCCSRINGLEDLNMPFLKKISLGYSNFGDDDIKHVLLHHDLDFLHISFNRKVTDTTLRNIRENCSNLDVLIAAYTGITRSGVIQYLSGMELSELGVSYDIYDREELLRNKVLREY